MSYTCLHAHWVLCLCASHGSFQNQEALIKYQLAMAVLSGSAGWLEETQAQGVQKLYLQRRRPRVREVWWFA